MPDAKYTGGIGSNPGDEKNWANKVTGKMLRSKEAVNANVARMMQKGAPEDDIKAYISQEGYDPETEITFWKRPSETAAFVEQSKTPALVSGFKAGLSNIRGNLLQLLHEGRGLIGTDTQKDVQKFNVEEEMRRARYAQSPAGQTLASTIGQGGAEALPWFAAPVPTNIGPAATMAYGTGLGLVQGATDFVPEGGSRLSNAMFGGLLGFGGGSAGAVMGPLAAKATNVARGIYAPAEKELMNLSQRYGVRLQYPDIRPSAPLAPTIGTVLEKTPLLGTGKERMLGAAEAELAAGKYKESLNIGNITNWKAATAQELENKESRLKTTVRVFYDAAAKRADPVGNLPTKNTIGEIDSLLSAERGAIDPDKALISQLEEWKLRLKHLPTNYSQLNSFQDSLQAAIRDSKSGGRFMSVSGGKLQKVKTALDKDIDPNIPKEALAYKKRADTIYKDKLEPFRDEVGKILQERDADAQFRMMMANLKGKPTTLFNSMTPRGQDAARYGLVNEAVEIAKNPNGTWSPAKFSKYIEDRKDLANAFFSGTSKDELDGFTKLMRASARHGQYAENPPTGLRGAIGTAMGAATVGPAVWLGWAANSPALAGLALTGAVGVPFLTKVMFTTQAGKKFLLAASKLKADDPRALQMLFQYYIPRAAEEGLAEARLRTQYGQEAGTQ